MAFFAYCIAKTQQNAGFLAPLGSARLFDKACRARLADEQVLVVHCAKSFENAALETSMGRVLAPTSILTFCWLTEPFTGKGSSCPTCSEPFERFLAFSLKKFASLFNALRTGNRNLPKMFLKCF